MMTSINLSESEYRDLLWSDLVRHDEFLTAITTEGDMMKRFEEKITGKLKEDKLVCSLFFKVFALTQIYPFRMLG
jgi:hypothetical protein